MRVVEKKATDKGERVKKTGRGGDGRKIQAQHNTSGSISRTRLVWSDDMQ